MARLGTCRDGQPCPLDDGGITTYIEDEYNGLSGGGDYEVWKCSVHGRFYLQLPD